MTQWNEPNGYFDFRDSDSPFHLSPTLMCAICYLFIYLFIYSNDFATINDSKGALLVSGGQDTDIVVWDMITDSGLFRFVLEKRNEDNNLPR
jgi:hypothetical protein